MLDQLDRSLREMTRDVARLESGALELPAEGHQRQLIGAAGVMSAAQDREFHASAQGDDIDGGEESKNEFLDSSQDDYIDTSY